MNIRRTFDTNGRARGWVLRCGLIIAAGMLALAGTAMAATINVPNGNFTDTGNDGSIGGILGSGGGRINNGPWYGNYNGVASLLLGPTLTIADVPTTGGTATISGLIGVNGLGILGNYGYFSQTLGTAYQPNYIYRLSADVDVGALLNLGVLSNGIGGIALTDGSGTVLTSTANPTAGPVTLSLLGGNTYRLTLPYTTGATASGNIGIRLFSIPQNLLSAGALNDVTFSNVALDGSPILVTSTSGSGQSANINTDFLCVLQVKATDDQSTPLAGVSFDFMAPLSGASATLTDGVSSGTQVTTATDANGIAGVAATANGIAGTFVVTAGLTGTNSPLVSWTLTNLGAGDRIFANGFEYVPAVCPGG